MKQTSTRQCTPQGYSVLLVYDQIKRDKPVSVDSICRKLGKKIYGLVLDNPIDIFLMGAVSDGYLDVSPNGYTLTEKGLKERELLRKLCSSS